MALSGLQKYILRQAYLNRGRLARSRLVEYYEKLQIKPSEYEQVKIIGKSIDRLIKRELLVGYGIKTAHKWFIKEIRLTLKGKKAARRLLGEQMKLPFFKNKKA